jgi:hypothetical protein
MQFTTLFLTLATIAVGAISAPTDDTNIITKRETSYGNPDLVVDQGDRWKLNFGSTDGHPNACPGHCECLHVYTEPRFIQTDLVL